jgi:hypothetical protein
MCAWAEKVGSVVLNVPQLVNELPVNEYDARYYKLKRDLAGWKEVYNHDKNRTGRLPNVLKEQSD